MLDQRGSRGGSLRNSAATSGGSPRTSKLACEVFADASTRTGLSTRSAALTLSQTETSTNQIAQEPAEAKTRSETRIIEDRCADAYGKGRVRKSALPSCSISTIAFASSSWSSCLTPFQPLIVS